MTDMDKPDDIAALEVQLRAALQPVAPPADMSRRLLQRFTGESAPSAHARVAWRWQWPLALAASLALVMIGVRVHSQRQAALEQEQGRQARLQVIEALRMTSHELDRVYRGVQKQDRPESRAADGA